MVRSATETTRRNRNLYLISSAVLLTFAAYLDAGGDVHVESTGRTFIPVFTAPTLIILMIIGMFTVGTREKWESEYEAMGGMSSAYSVFNEGGRGIAGTTTAEELDRQLRGGVARLKEDAGEGMKTSGGTLGMRHRLGRPEARVGTPSQEKRQYQLRRERADAAYRRMTGETE